MTYGNMPMMIFILAAGYLFTVYLLLGLAKRIGKKPVHENVSPVPLEKEPEELPLTPTVTEIVNSQ
ncbi:MULTISPECIES: hypothetical protein [unclassified Anabaena]|uniref:hypothetical protein n=2 Tax=unclassified Anabaena TaxID=2619674 RepID=UPI0012E8E3D8|nr:MULTISPECIES: hypothetical protein [unclassified Anabaena]